jgi:hypothetical protein
MARSIEGAAMGEHLRTRETQEKLTMTMTVINEMIPAVNNQGQFLQKLGQIVQELSNRTTAMEIVLSRYLEHHTDTTWNDLLSAHIAEFESKQQEENSHATQEAGRDDQPTGPDGTADAELGQSDGPGDEQESSQVSG